MYIAPIARIVRGLEKKLGTKCWLTVWKKSSPVIRQGSVTVAVEALSGNAVAVRRLAVDLHIDDKVLLAAETGFWNWPSSVASNEASDT